MIRFACVCGQKIRVPDEYAGKKGRCPRCNQACRIPSLEETPTIKNTPRPPRVPREPDPAPAETRGTPVWVWCIFGTVFVLLVAFMLYAVTNRTSWELEHKRAIYEMCDSIVRLAGDRDVSGAERKEDELVAFIGGREIKDAALRDAVRDARASIMQARVDLRERQQRVADRQRAAERKDQEEEVLARVLSIESRIDSLMTQKAFAQAIEACDNLFRIASGYENVSEISRCISRARTARRRAQNEEDKIAAEQRRIQVALAEELAREQRIEREQERQAELANVYAVQSRIAGTAKIAGLYYDADTIIQLIPTSDAVEGIAIAYAIDRTNVLISTAVSQSSANEYSRAVDDPRYYGTSAAAEQELYYKGDRAQRDLANLKVIFANFESGTANIKSELVANPDFRQRWDNAVSKYKNSEYLPDDIRANLRYAAQF